MTRKNRAIVLFTIIIASTCPGQTNPTMSQLDSLWRDFYGPNTHQCIVVYNKMTSAESEQGHISLDTLCIMRLLGEDNQASIKQLFPYEQAPSPFGAWYWGVTSGYAISRDGSRVAAQNSHGVIVCDSSGSHMKVISTSDINNDCISLSFDDTLQGGATVHRIVYASMPWLILRTTLSDTNTALETDTLWTLTDSCPCYDNMSQTNGFTSVNKNGRFLSFNLVVMSGACIPVVVDLNTGEYQLPLGGCYNDGCQIRSCWDTSGTVSFHVWSHRIPTALWKWDTPGGINDGSVPCLIDPAGCSIANGDPGQGGYYWCENDTNYMIQVGDNDVINSPGCYSKAYIRRGKTTDPPEVMYLGDYMGWPAMWIDSEPFSTGVIRDRPRSSRAFSRVSMKISRNEITLVNKLEAALSNIRLVDARGVAVSRGEKTSVNEYRLGIGNLPNGVYFLSWQELNAVKARIVTISH